LRDCEAVRGADASLHPSDIKGAKARQPGSIRMNFSKEFFLEPKPESAVFWQKTVEAPAVGS
jgi:hypothetical protein